MGKKLEGKTVLLIVPPTQFREEEVFEPKRILEKEGADVVVASTIARICRGTRGGVIDATVAIEGATAESFDAVVLAGGLSVPDYFWKDTKLVEFVAAMSEAGKLVAAISLSTVVLAKAKLLEGREATVYYLPEALEELKNGGAAYVEKKLIVDGNLVMAEGPGAVGSFTDAIVTALAN
jgi:protease I